VAIEKRISRVTGSSRVPKLPRGGLRDPLNKGAIIGTQGTKEAEGKERKSQCPGNATIHPNSSVGSGRPKETHKLSMREDIEEAHIIRIPSETPCVIEERKREQKSRNRSADDVYSPFPIPSSLLSSPRPTGTTK
jgi:hypothetical protein